MRFGIIGGSGVGQLLPLEDAQPITIATRFGEAHCLLGKLGNKEVVFLHRHGKGHTLPPHRINYRANVLAMKRLGVKTVLATAAVGTLQPTVPPGTLLVPDQLLDWTRQRPLTLFEGNDAPVVHVDVTNPFCPTLRQRLLQAAQALGIPLQGEGCYVCGEGPRYETAFEVRLLAQWGATVAGMTAGTEAVLFREAEICYAILAIVTNWGAGLSPHPLSHAEVEATMQQKAPQVARLFEQVIATFDFPDCPCQHALEAYGDNPRSWLQGA